MSVTFWGVRGSIACPSPRHVIYGGNTSCIELMVGGNRLILDAGTGIRILGQQVMREEARPGILLLTHTHWDHINGFPFFIPLYVKGRSFRVLAGHLYDNGGIKSVLSSQMMTPLFPVPLAALQATMSYEDFRCGETLTDLLPDLVVKTWPLRHPDRATGYRFEHGGRVISYITDTEHIIGQPDQNVLALMDRADLAIYDSTYTDEEFPAKVGWGHSTWEEAVRLARIAGVKRLAIFHHDPDHTDTVMERIETAAQEAFPGAFVAREGLSLTFD